VLPVAPVALLAAAVPQIRTGHVLLVEVQKPAVRQLAGALEVGAAVRDSPTGTLLVLGFLAQAVPIGRLPRPLVAQGARFEP
jgi:hypothetical protein